MVNAPRVFIFFFLRDFSLLFLSKCNSFVRWAEDSGLSWQTSFDERERKRTVYLSLYSWSETTFGVVVWEKSLGTVIRSRTSESEVRMGSWSCHKYQVRRPGGEPETEDPKGSRSGLGYRGLRSDRCYLTPRFGHGCASDLRMGSSGTVTWSGSFGSEVRVSTPESEVRPGVLVSTVRVGHLGSRSDWDHQCVGSGRDVESDFWVESRSSCRNLDPKSGRGHLYTRSLCQ